MRYPKKDLKALRKTVKDFRVQGGESLLLEVANDLWYRLDTPTSLGLALCARHGDLLSILQHKVDPSKYLTAETFALDYQAISFLRKCPLSVNPLEARISLAQDKFFEAEEMCRQTNQRFKDRSRRNAGSSPAVESVLCGAQRKIYQWLGPRPDVRDWLERCRFGPGSDDQSSGHYVGPYHKLSPLSATADFVDGALAIVLEHPAWAFAAAGLSPYLPDGTETPDGTRGEITVLISPGDTIVFVPKDAMVERTIGIGARMNVFAQLGLGGLIRTHLKHRAHNDLSSQLINQELAYEASIQGHLATVDLSMASDTIAIELVRFLLPEGWFIPLDWCRSKHAVLWDDSTVRYEKFSSMGNGYTFELESLIFLSLVTACCIELGLDTKKVRVYGDDIICPVGAVALLEEVLSYSGFRMNTAKSFSSGVFRESCGADFFDGTNVRPHFCKEVPTDVSSLYNLANGIRRAAYSRGRGLCCDYRFRPAWLRTVARLPKSLRWLYSPPVKTERRWGATFEAGDGGLVLNSDEALSSPLTRFSREWGEGFTFGTLSPIAWKDQSESFHSEQLLTYALYRCRDGLAPDTEPGMVSGRGVTGKRLTTRVYTRVLGELGPWI